LRLFQAIALVIAAYPPLLTLVTPLSPEFTLDASVGTYLQFGGRLNIIRRTMRLFRFLDSFQAAFAALGGSGEAKGLGVWCDILAASFWGMFGFAESATLLDLLDVENLEVFGPDLTAEINYQAQMVWLLALCASALGSAVRIIQGLAYRPVPQSGAFGGTGEDPAKAIDDSPSNATSNATEKELLKKDDVHSERERLRGLAEKQKEQRKASEKKQGAELSRLTMRLTADVLDMVVPAATLGWIDVPPVLVGGIMVVTTILTAMDPWQRCGAEAVAKRNQV
jgi:hypothetical protein